MVLQFRKNTGLFVSRSIFVLAFVNLFSALAIASISSIWAIYINSFVNNTGITGLISAGLTLVSFVSYFFFIPLVQKSRKSALFVYSLILLCITYLLFFFNRNFIIFLVLACVITAIYTIRVSVFGIIVRDKSKRGELSENEGFIYTFLNLGWVIGPFVGGYIASFLGNNYVFLFAFLLCFAGLMTFIFSKVNDSNRTIKTDGDFFRNFFEFFRDRQRMSAYLFRGGTFIWWTLIYIFMPLYIIESGLGGIWVGYFLFAVAVPLIVSEYIFSKMAKHYGYRKIFMTGFFIAFVFAIAAFFSRDIYVDMLLLIFAAFGIAMLEPTTEAYFLEVSSRKDINRFYGPFNTSVDVMQFIGKVLAALMLFFFAFEYLFLLFAFFMLVMFVFAYRHKNMK
ncbi:hypothetical protein CO038_02360 [Candidatus Pacearchaeota archaeon CG_4_9_14_0_2_um_filter_39_13]|nr:MFS transporter [Candidatus Pacearchaeota archaeon]PJC44788.1 MAG: hypothetical protein CO038_02360 [Candidatus Pacearchaeota archaeon CG_4_9_14_0_2_um_filter_39_13]